MKDVLLTPDGDLFIDPATGDVVITDSVAQAIMIRLRWFWSEWRLGPKYGIPYREEILIKNPSKLRIRQIFREEIMSVEEVDDVVELSADVNQVTRVLSVRYKVIATDGEEHGGEVNFNA